MKETNETLEESTLKTSNLTAPAALQSYEDVEMPGIFISKETISNMEMERIMVAGFAVVDILSRTQLSQSAQEEAIDKLVDRTPNFIKLKPEVAVEKIKMVLTQETVIEYLRHQDIIRKNADMVEVGVDKEGSLVVTAFYTKLSRDVRRALKKQYDAKDMAKAEAAINILEGEDNLVSLAAARLKKLQESGKKTPKPKR
jgi:hypothetical protein